MQIAHEVVGVIVCGSPILTSVAAGLVFARHLAVIKAPKLAGALHTLQAVTAIRAQQQDDTQGAEILASHQVETAELGPLAKLPPFGPVVMTLLRLFDRADVEIDSIARLVECDPAMAAELLAVANSPSFGFRGKVSSLAHGIALLGIDRTKSLVITLAKRSVMNDAPRTTVVRRLWAHALATAAVAREFAEAFEVPGDLAHTAGMVHDLGRMALLAAHPTEYSRLALATHDTEAEIGADEEARFGMDHGQAGSLLARAWGFPEALLKVVECHHEAPPCLDLISLVRLSCRLADNFMFQAIRHEDSRELAEIIETCAPEAVSGSVTDGLQAAKLCAIRTIQALDF